jgi:hypothetical protein
MSTQGSGRRVEAEWPRLVLDGWTDTRQTLHMWTRIVGGRSAPPGSAVASGSGMDRAASRIPGRNAG